MIKGIDPKTAPIKGILEQQAKPITEPGKSPGGVSFSDFLLENVKEVNRLGIEGDKAIQQRLSGQEVNPHATLISLQKADISFRLMLAVKDRLVEAYQQVIRTPIG